MAFTIMSEAATTIADLYTPELYIGALYRLTV